MKTEQWEAGVEWLSRLHDKVGEIVRGEASASCSALTREHLSDWATRISGVASDVSDVRAVQSSLSRLRELLHQEPTAKFPYEAYALADGAAKLFGVLYDPAPVIDPKLLQVRAIFPAPEVLGPVKDTSVETCIALPTTRCWIKDWQKDGVAELVGVKVLPGEQMRLCVVPPEDSALRNTSSFKADGYCSLHLSDVRLDVSETVVRPDAVWADLWVVGEGRQPNNRDTAQARREMLEDAAGWRFEVSNNLLPAHVFLDAVHQSNGHRVRMDMPHPLWRLEHVSGPEANNRFCLVRAIHDVLPVLRLAREQQRTREMEAARGVVSAAP